jgi:hypothetical protein
MFESTASEFPLSILNKGGGPVMTDQLPLASQSERDSHCPLWSRLAGQLVEVWNRSAPNDKSSLEPLWL